ncbi:MAG: CPBP family glutamic-type intramembrane protease [Chitinispirillia bacterium]
MKFISGSIAVIFALISILYLLNSPPYANCLPHFESVFFLKISNKMVLLISTISLLMLYLSSLTSLGTIMVYFVTICLAILTLIKLYILINIKLVICSFFIGGLIGLTNKFIALHSTSWSILSSIITILFFISGVILVNHTKLINIPSLEGKVKKGGLLFLYGILISIPFALFNHLGGMYKHDDWITYWWQPLAALKAGIYEETFFRLFLATFFYALMRPIFKSNPKNAIVLVVLFSSFLFVISHMGFNIPAQIVGLIIFSIPKALFYIKYGFEFAIGFHFFNDFVRYTAAYLLFSNGQA